jgi:uncharacterized protein
VSRVLVQDGNPSRSPADAGVVAATAVGLVAWNNLVAARPWHARHYVLANLGSTAALLTLARLRGVPAGELGLSSQRVAAGARTGAAVGTPIMALWAGVVLSPHRALLRDARLAGLSARAIGYHAAVRVPLGTAVWEEVAFRAVSPALLRRAMPARTAAAVNAILFGLWHIRPTLDAVRLNGMATTRPRRSAAGAGAVAAGALVDVLLSFLHRWCGSLLAPTLVHVASNSGGMIAVAVAGRARPLPKPPPVSCAGRCSSSK